MSNNFPPTNNPLTADEKLDKVLAFVSNINSDVLEIKTELVSVHQTVDGHTTVLDAIVKNTSDWQAEMVVMRNRLSRYEQALKLVGEKLNLDIDSLLRS